MADPRIKQQLIHLLEAAAHVAETTRAQAVVLLTQTPLDWNALRRYFQTDVELMVACPRAALPRGHQEDRNPDKLYRRFGIRWIPMEDVDLPVMEQITTTLLEAVATELFRPGDTVVVLYPGFMPETIDTLSVVPLGERLHRYTARDLERLETSIPLKTIQTVIDLALDIGREGREGKAVGTMFVVGDVENVRKYAKAMGLDPFAKVPKSSRNLKDKRLREDVKELAQLDGAFIIDDDGNVVASRQWIAAPAERITMTKGLGSRHWAAAAISKATNAVAVTVSQSSGTVRVFKDGEVILRLEPTKRRVLKWQEFDYEPPLERLRPYERVSKNRSREEASAKSERR